MSGGQDKTERVPFKQKMEEVRSGSGFPHTIRADNAVDHPDHYNRGKIETIDFIEDREHLGFGRLNAIKYIDRSGAKVGESKEQSIRKAIWYLEREIGMHKKGEL